MVHFSIRDLLWLTLVAAMGAGWYVHYQRVRAEGLAHEQMVRAALDESRMQLNRWTRAAQAMEEVLKKEGWDVSWDTWDDQQILHVGWQGNGRSSRGGVSSASYTTPLDHDFFQPPANQGE